MSSLQAQRAALNAQIKQKAAGKKKENKAFLQSLRKRSAAEVNNAFHEAHEQVFACTDCLQCANCCSHTGPLFTAKDMDRIAKHLGMRSAQFAERYLRLDEDGDHVLQSLPCPFLADDNHCGIYEVRPKACREFPHTDHRNMQDITAITLRNTAVCPAVFDILEKVKLRLASKR